MHDMMHYMAWHGIGRYSGFGVHNLTVLDICKDTYGVQSTSLEYSMSRMNYMQGRIYIFNISVHVYAVCCSIFSVHKSTSAEKPAGTHSFLSCSRHSSDLDTNRTLVQTCSGVDLELRRVGILFAVRSIVHLLIPRIWRNRARWM